MGSTNLNIRWHQTQLLPWDYAYVYVTPGLHTDFSDISISIRKWKRFLFAYAYAYVTPGLHCLCLCLCSLRRIVNRAYDVIYSTFQRRIGTSKINGGRRFTEIEGPKNARSILRKISREDLLCAKM